MKPNSSFLPVLCSLFTHAAMPATPDDGSVLPFPPTPSASIAKPRLQDSVHKRRVEPSRLPKDAPNILIILIDDVGFGMPDTFGGFAHTPTLTRLCHEGISYNRFHTTAICSPTRASLLTGRNHQRVGSGTIAERAVDWDGYTGIIPKTSATIAEVLRHYGYKTSAFGKWHNTPADQTTAMGPFDYWPTGYGFDYFYGFLAGETSQWEPRLVENTTAVEPPARREISPHRGHGGQGHHLAEEAPRLCAGQTIFHVLGARRCPRPASYRHGVGGEIQRQVRSGLGQAARGGLRAAESLGWIPANTELTPRRSHHGRVGQTFPSPSVPSSRA